MKIAPLSLLCAAVALSLGTPAMAQNMTKDQYASEKDKIAADYKAAKAACDSQSGNAKDVCVADAKGKEKVAKAELEARYQPSAKNTYDAKVAKADADYKVANEKCDDLKGNEKKVCQKTAKDAQVHATADAKAAMKSDKAQAAAADKSGDAQQKAAAKKAEAQHDAAQDKRDADYAVAKAKCDALSGNAKDACVAQAKTQYGK